MEKITARVGVIGGSGVYEMNALTNKRILQIDTPWGHPSDEILIGEIDGVSVAFIPRHGRGHFLSPSQVPYLANIYALRSLGVHHVVAATAVGALKESTPPGTFVFIDQYIDRTNYRLQTFFSDGIVAHVPMANPICSEMVNVLYKHAKHLDLKCSLGGTYICMEGPQFSTRAESDLYRTWGGDVIGMTNMTEAKLAREAGMSFASIAMVTDYDCWHPNHSDVDVQQILATATKNAEDVAGLLEVALPQIGRLGDSPWRDVLKTAIMTSKEKWPEAAILDLKALLPQ